MLPVGPAKGAAVIAGFLSVVLSPEIICILENMVGGRIRGPGSFLGRSNHLLQGRWELPGSHRLRNDSEAARPSWTDPTEIEVSK